MVDARAIDSYIESGRGRSLGLVDHICPACKNIQGVAMFEEYGVCDYDNEDDLTCKMCGGVMFSKDQLKDCVKALEDKEQATREATKKLRCMSYKALKELWVKVDRERCSIWGLDAPDWLTLANQRMQDIEEDKAEKERKRYERKMLGGPKKYTKCLPRI